MGVTVLYPGVEVGHLTVIERQEKGCRCRCTCGNECFRTYTTLYKAISVNSDLYCSGDCSERLYRITRIDVNDIVGKKFNRLKVIRYSHTVRYTIGNKYYYECICDCGNIVVVERQNLLSGHTLSCGCIRSMGHLFVEGTNLSLIRDDKAVRVDNKSGHTGVCYDKGGRVWKAYIGFRGVKYHLGNFKDKQGAIDARERAEKEYWGEIRERYGSLCNKENLKKSIKSS